MLTISYRGIKIVWGTIDPSPPRKVEIELILKGELVRLYLLKFLGTLSLLMTGGEIWDRKRDFTDLLVKELLALGRDW